MSGQPLMYFTSHREEELLVRRYIIRQEARRICSGGSFRSRTAALSDFDGRCLEAFGEAFLDVGMERKAFFRFVGKKLKSLWGLFKKAPKVWGKVKGFLGIRKLTDIPSKIREWVRRGSDTFKRVVGPTIRKNMYLAMYFIPRKRLPSLKDIANKMLAASPAIKKGVSAVRGKVMQLTRLIDGNKVLKSLKRPVRAAIYIYVWLNSGMDFDDPKEMVKGFVGQVSVSEVITSSAVEAIGSLIVPGGQYLAAPAVFMAQMIHMEKQGMIEWKPGRGFLVKWNKVGGSAAGRPDEMVPVF